MRKHVAERTSLFVPPRLLDGPKPDELSTVRITHVSYVDGTLDVVRDDWKDPVNARRVLPLRWTGETWLFLEGHQPDVAPPSSPE